MCETRISSLLGKITVLVVICCFCLPVKAKYGGGTGEPNDPYLIYTASQMNAIGADSNDWDKHFLLCADIDLSGFTGTSFNIIGINSDNPFIGVFDGNGHTIFNFSFTSTDTDNIGLFGYVDGGEVKNLGLINPDVYAGTGRYVGSLVGWLRDGTISNCYVDGGSVAGYGDVGGLVGNNSQGTITNCYATCSVSGVFDTGGLIGDNDGTVTDCYSTGSVSGDGRVGGLVGWNYYGIITNCYSTGSVMGNGDIGGLVGYNSGPITNSYSIAGVSGDDNVGGLVGRNYSTIIGCYSTGSVLGESQVGGLVGDNSGHVVSSYWDIETSGQAISAGGKGKTTAQMMMTGTFLHWGTCDEVWTINEGLDYPRLTWEQRPGEPIVGIIPFEGDGVPDNPYLIHTPEQLNVIGLLPCVWDKNFKLMANIDLSQYTGTEFNIIVRFTGTFDGNGHTISNFTYTSTGKDDIGLFGFVGDPNAVIKSLGLIDPDVDAGSGHYVGSLVGQLDNGTINNCYIERGSVSGSYSYHIGGLVGCNNYGTISECYSTCSVSGFLRVGGFVGWNNYGTISMCYSSGSVSGGSSVGGLAGLNDGTITNCYSTGSVSERRSVGGLVGDNRGTITNCYATGSVSGNKYVGGLVGRNYSTIIGCYSTGSVSGESQVGGLVGDNSGHVISSYWDIETSGQAISAGGKGKTTAQMMMTGTFLHWGTCDEVWTINEGVDYPRLTWEQRPGEPIVGIIPFEGGGVPDNPYLIHTPEQLNVIGLLPCVWDKHFKLMANIDLSQYTGTEFNIIVLFTGTFDGNGHTISNFSYTSISTISTQSIGLFGYVDDPNAQIKNLGLIDPNVDAGSENYVGSLVGQLDNGSITNCYIEGGNVSGSLRVGGLVGWNDYGTITNSYSTCIVSGNQYVGGLVGRNRYGAIANCYTTGSVSGNKYVGGLVGRSYGGVTASFWDIETSGQTTSDGGTGLPTAEMQTMSTFTDAGWDFNTPVWTIDEGVDYPHLWWEFVPVLHAEPEVTLGTSNPISWEPVVVGVEYYAECAEDANFTSIIYSTGWIAETSCEFTGLELGKRYWYSVKARNAAGVESQWSNVEFSLQGTLADVVETLLNTESLKNKNMKNALLNKIDAALKMIEEANYTGALSKLQNDILAKTNGCSEKGEPDKNDWIITCEQQSEIYPLVIETIEHVKGLMGE